jgi:hypothetical protein
VRATLVVARPPSVFLLVPGERPLELPGGTGPRGEPRLAPGLLERLPSGPEPIVACGEELARALARATGRPVRLADPRSWNAALAALPPAAPGPEREGFLERGRAALESALRSPSEVLVSLAREEERLERAVGREARAAEAFVPVRGTALAEYSALWQRAREPANEHHRALLRLLETEARRTLPNLSAVLGPRVAARLAASAGGTAPLARVSASRLQLLGSRRRPSPDRGPRFGVLYLAEGLDEVPPDRRAAFARSVAALAAIAARADVITHADLADELVRRRNARRDRLLRGRR